ncbi:type VI secretion system tube protein Hcp [bacterium]|nr:type VI secretion system tube protein Hcp [bacterium]
MRTSRLFLLVFVLAGFVGAASQGCTACQVYLRLEGISGVSTDADHRAWLDCTTFDVPLATNELDGSVQPTNRMRIIRRVDAASSALRHATASGLYVKWACLAVRKTGPGAPAGDYFLATFFRNHITAYQSASTPTAPTEDFTLQFGTVVWQYRQPGPKGTFGPLETGGYRGDNGLCYPHQGYETWTGRKLGDPALPLRVPVAFPIIAARALAAGR